MRPYTKEKLTNKDVYFITFSLFPPTPNIDWTFRILKDMFMLFLGPICYEEETVNSIVRTSVVLHSLLRIREGLFRELGENFAGN